MEHEKLETFMQSVKTSCKRLNRQMTKSRQRVLEILFRAEVPVSAYEVRDLYNQSVKSPIRPMSVYRILHFLESLKFVHKLNTVNKYIACKSLAEKCQHQTTLFLICKSCQRIEISQTPTKILHSLHQQIKTQGFSADNSQLEVITLCGECEQKNAAKNDIL